MSQSKNINTAIPSPQPSDGLRLTGLVVASQVKPVSWDNTNYNQLKLTIICGDQTLYYIAKDTDGPLPVVHAFTRIEISVNYAKTDKGIISVGGMIVEDAA